MKRILSLALAVLMVLSMAVFVHAEETDIPVEITPETVGADGITGDAVITLYEDPVVTTMGTKADLLSGLPANEAGKKIYTAQTDGSRGFAFIFKIEGSEDGDIIGKFDMNVTARRITGTDAETGEKAYSDPETRGPIWNGNWVNDGYSTNSIELWGDGYYIYWFPFRNIDNNWTNVETIKGETTLNEAYIFHQTGALGNNRAGKIVADPDVTVSCLGIIEGSIDAYDVIAYNKLTEQYEALSSGVSINALSGSNTAQWRKIAPPDEIFGGLFGAGDGEYVASWTDRNDNPIEDTLTCLLGLKVVKPVYEQYDAAELKSLSFVDAEGTVIGEGEFLNGVGFITADIPADVEKAGDGVIAYDFLGWSIDGETVIDIYSAEYEGDTTLKPVFAQYGAHFDADPVKLPLVSSQVSEVIDDTKTTTDDNGNTIEYITKTTTVTMTYEGEEPVTKSTSLTYKRTTGSDGVVLKSEYVNNTSKNEIEALNVLPESFSIDPAATGTTFIYKVDGVESELIADNISVSANGRTFNGAWQWDDPYYSNDGLAPCQLNLENGYFYLYLNANIYGVTIGNYTYVEFELFHGSENQALVSEDGVSLRAPINENENATFQLLAATSSNLTPTVNFHGTDGEYLGSYTHKYTDVNRNLSYGRTEAQKSSCLNGNLLTPAEIFAMLQETDSTVVAPTKAGEIDEVVYVLDGWQDADGNIVDAVYADGDLYPHFKVVDNRTKYNVVFKNYDGSTLYEYIVPEDVVPEYTGLTPEKPSTETNSYVFKGWDKELTATPVTPEADGGDGGEIVYIAQYEEVERRYNVTFYEEDGKTFFHKILNVKKGEAAVIDETPEKAADVQYTYEFDKWVDLEGNAVDLNNITADMEVRATYKGTLNKYTVTFIDEDGESELGTSTVDYGTAADAPEATKDADEWYVYEFAAWVDAEGEEVDITAVKGDMTVYATYSSIFTPKDYDDIQPPMPTWYGPAVEYVLINGIMNGMDGGFKPNVTMSRAMVVTVLYRYMGEPEVEVPEDFVNFSDNTKATSWYYNAVIWGAVNGVVDGRGNGIFDPNGNVTREEFVTILYRFSDEVMGEYMGYGRSSLSYFYDREKVSSWAHTAVKWAYATADDLDTQGSTPYNKTQYITGTGVKDGKAIFSPKANATRAQVAVMLYRYMTGERIAK